LIKKERKGQHYKFKKKEEYHKNGMPTRNNKNIRSNPKPELGNLKPNSSY
jgi:hypothetical protein